jgi:hypothetical protein
MEGNKLHIVLGLGEDMSVRRSLIQLGTKLAMGLGALFLVGVLLAAIPNHRAPVLEGISPAPGQEAKEPDHSTVSGIDMDKAKSSEKNAARGGRHRQGPEPESGSPVR